ncbi:sigma-54-dependent Fis family transcriptional regulator [Massilia psychrophila]|uniref:Sigma-54-dependent Fis family transcriptional regulator n=1 Tax=Massilia psychrophila TaxID=1603353 RepID=A0A2G8SXC3_9BURK|nr:sigma-54-dependent Fis family transcriptional regulator [Massilia psychrophila]PIL38440.1 sigma-54-dependent Fis family transcriptional regulator [Massilia psychrophila]GGE84098.1 sigma-54-dependent Fis family transcriptional regulator [Massilia psychrophila]
MSNFAVEHVKRVRSVVQTGMDRQPASSAAHGAPAGGSRITESWIRCLNDYHLDPDSRDDPEVVGYTELQERQESLADLRAVAEVEMADLYQQLAGSGYAIMLTDRDGVLLSFFGDPGFTHAASKSGLMQGAVWSERVQGTNGMGTCLVERRPISVHQEEHYLSRNIGLSCAAAPIFNHAGELVAVLDASGESRLAQQHTLALVSASVQMIENRVFLHQFRNEYIVRFHNRPEFVGTLSEGAIAVSVAGRVLAATRRALLMLGIKSPLEIVGRDITDLFNISFSGLVDCTVKKAFHPVPIFEIRNGARFFAVSYAPLPAQREARQPAPAARVPAADAATALDKLQFGDPAMLHNVQIAKRVVERNVAVMLLGETGTGKEMFAQALHRSGSRAAKPFVAINCASIPEALIESELFGYTPGAFTGARKDGQCGKILQANGGTLFLDEIGDMPVALQTRLLRVLEEREVLPLGGGAPIKLDIRLISATHCDLQERIGRKQFREDLFYRLQGVTITLPPLRDRADRPQLVRHLVRQESEGDDNVRVDDELLAALVRHSWPGNIRQLRHLLRTMIALRESDRLTMADLPLEFGAASTAAASVTAETAAATAVGPAPDANLNPLENAERHALIEELTRHSWNISTLARQLKISRNTLYRKVQRLKIINPDKTMLH